MKVILLEDAQGIGKKGAVLNVADGYARNYLIPRKIAVEASESNLKSLQHQKRQQDERAKRLLAEAREAAKVLENATVKVKAKAGESGRLFGSITSKDIAEAIDRTFGIAVDRKRIDIDEQIKTVGLYMATIRLHQDVEVKINVHVVSGEANS